MFFAPKKNVFFVVLIIVSAHFFTIYATRFNEVIMILDPDGSEKNRIGAVSNAFFQAFMQQQKPILVSGRVVHFFIKNSALVGHEVIERLKLDLTRYVDIHNKVPDLQAFIESSLSRYSREKFLPEFKKFITLQLILALGLPTGFSIAGWDCFYQQETDLLLFIPRDYAQKKYYTDFEDIIKQLGLFYAEMNDETKKAYTSLTEYNHRKDLDFNVLYTKIVNSLDYEPGQNTAIALIVHRLHQGFIVKNRISEPGVKVNAGFNVERMLSIRTKDELLKILETQDKEPSYANVVDGILQILGANFFRSQTLTRVIHPAQWIIFAVGHGFTAGRLDSAAQDKMVKEFDIKIGEIKAEVARNADWKKIKDEQIAQRNTIETMKIALEKMVAAHSILEKQQPDLVDQLRKLQNQANDVKPRTIIRVVYPENADPFADDVVGQEITEEEGSSVEYEKYLGHIEKIQKDITDVQLKIAESNHVLMQQKAAIEEEIKRAIPERDWVVMQRTHARDVLRLQNVLQERQHLLLASSKAVYSLASSQVVGLPVAEFYRLLNSLVNVQFFYFMSCFSGGVNQAALTHQLNAMRTKFIVGQQGVGEDVTAILGVTRLPLKIIDRGILGKGVIIDQELDFEDFFKRMKRFFGSYDVFSPGLVDAKIPDKPETLASALLSLIPKKSYSSLNALPFIYVPHLGAFSALKFDETVFLLTHAEAKKAALQGSNFDVRTYKEVLVLPPYISAPMRTGKNTNLRFLADASSIMAGNVVGFKEETAAQYIDWLKSDDELVNFLISLVKSNLAKSKTLFIRKLAYGDPQKTLTNVIINVVVGLTNSYVAVFYEKAKSFAGFVWQTQTGFTRESYEKDKKNFESGSFSNLAKVIRQFFSEDHIKKMAANAHPYQTVWNESIRLIKEKANVFSQQAIFDMNYAQGVKLLRMLELSLEKLQTDLSEKEKSSLSAAKIELHKSRAINRLASISRSLAHAKRIGERLGKLISTLSEPEKKECLVRMDLFEKRLKEMSERFALLNSSDVYTSLVEGKKLQEKGDVSTGTPS